MRLFIAEKPELARAIVEGLGGGRKAAGYIDCGEDKVTWCFGHMLSLFDPEDYDAKYSKWNLADLPISHIPWKKKPNPKSKDQLQVILSLLKKANQVVHAGDPDDEGQLLVDEILAYAKCKAPAKRLLINDNNTSVVKKALASMRDNIEFQGLSDSAEARSVADQLYGYNLTRGYTLTAQQKGHQGVLSVGRVQTPILGLVVRRDREHESHQKSYYYDVTADFDVDGTEFTAKLVTDDQDTIDEKGCLLDAAQAQGIADSVTNQAATIKQSKSGIMREAPPLPYNLLKLQTDCSRKFGYRPDQVKDITQALRERHRLITYNRSDCQYLSDEQHGDGPEVLHAIGQTATVLAGASQRANPSIKSRAFNSSKVSAHHAIIPTATSGDFSTLSDAERKVYSLIARAYVAQFWPDHQYRQTDLTISVAGRDFKVTSKISTDLGWKKLYKNDQDNDEVKNDGKAIATPLDALKQGQTGFCQKGICSQKETKPLPYYTMATLLADLTRVAKYIKDDGLRKALIEKDKSKAGEHGGIGTPATRDSIIKNLFDRGFLTEKGKSVISTSVGRSFYDLLPDTAKYPDMTAIWHGQQQEIVAGNLSPVKFIRGLMEFIGKEIDGLQDGMSTFESDAPICPECKEHHLRRISGKKGYFWGCSGFKDGCKATYPDKGVKPDLNPKKKVPATVSSVYSCKECGKGLVRRSTRKKGKYFWGCSGYPDCDQTYFDKLGRPVFESARKKSG